MTAFDTITKVEARDPGTAALLLEFALYEAVCDEADRVRPELEAAFSKQMNEKAAQGLRYLARQPINEATISAANGLVELMEFSKTTPAPPALPTGGPEYEEHHNVTHGDGGRWVSRHGKIRRAIVNALGYATTPENQDRKINAATTLGQFAGPNADNFSRLRGLGGALAHSGDPNAGPVGTALQLVGDIGPEARAALEPGIIRTAYRYRGTERRPDATLQARVAEISAGLSGRGEDQKRLATLSDIGVATLYKQIPDRETAAISLAAGKMPPSVGLLFDGQGHLVSEAMGFNGDHYLPFDLSNLKRLKGGSYVRTRTTGGLTDEDIYTGLMTGARHVTVVSNSGVFTLEFDKDLRGGRRYSDKARQMVDRYARLVGAINSGRLYENKLPQADQAKLREDSLKAAGNNAARAKEIYAQKLSDAQANSAFLGADDEELRSRAEARVMANPKSKDLSRPGLARAIDAEYAALRQDEDDTAVRAYKLDGRGYERAAQALQTEFPYYIRSVNYTPLQKHIDTHQLGNPDDPRRKGGGTDLGHMVRNATQPGRAGVPKVNRETGQRLTGADAGREILGAPVRGTGSSTATAGGAATPATGAPAARAGGAGGGFGPAPAAGGAAAGAATPNNLTERITNARTNMRMPLYNALVKSAKASSAASLADIEDPPRDGNGGILSPEDALSTDCLAQSYPKWMYQKYEQDWSKVAQVLLDSKPEVIAKFRAGTEEIKRAVSTGQVAGYDKFDEADKLLGDLQVLSQPFSEVTDPALAPLGAKSPPAVPSVVSLDIGRAEEFETWRAQDENKVASQFADGWQDASDEDISQEIASYAERVTKVARWVNAGAHEDDLQGVNLNQDEELITALKDNPTDSPAVKQVADMNTAWSFLRMRRIAQITSGAAVPLAPPGGDPVPVFKGRSTPSRLVRHAPGSPRMVELAKALRSRR